MSILAVVGPTLLKLFVERIKTKSTAASVLPLATAAVVFEGNTPLAPDSIEGIIVQLITAVLGLYLFFKKEKTTT